MVPKASLKKVIFCHDSDEAVSSDWWHLKIELTLIYPAIGKNISTQLKSDFCA